MNIDARIPDKKDTRLDELTGMGKFSEENEKLVALSMFLRNGHLKMSLSLGEHSDVSSFTPLNQKSIVHSNQQILPANKASKVQKTMFGFPEREEPPCLRISAGIIKAPKVSTYQVITCLNTYRGTEFHRRH